MVWRCSYGVINCPICKRHSEEVAERQEKEKRLKRIQDQLQAGRVKVKFKNGKPVFEGLTVEERAGASDDCILHALMVSGSATARAAIARAEQLSGRATQLNR